MLVLKVGVDQSLSHPYSNPPSPADIGSNVMNWISKQLSACVSSEAVIQQSGERGEG
jgi:hypothetical protein